MFVSELACWISFRCFETVAVCFFLMIWLVVPLWPEMALCVRQINFFRSYHNSEDWYYELYLSNDFYTFIAYFLTTSVVFFLGLMTYPALLTPFGHGPAKLLWKKYFAGLKDMYANPDDKDYFDLHYETRCQGLSSLTFIMITEIICLPIILLSSFIPWTGYQGRYLYKLLAFQWHTWGKHPPDNNTHFEMAVSEVTMSLYYLAAQGLLAIKRCCLQGFAYFFGTVFLLLTPSSFKSACADLSMMWRDWSNEAGAVKAAAALLYAEYLGGGLPERAFSYTQALFHDAEDAYTFGDPPVNHIRGCGADEVRGYPLTFTELTSTHYQDMEKTYDVHAREYHPISYNQSRMQFLADMLYLRSMNRVDITHGNHMAYYVLVESLRHFVLDTASYVPLVMGMLSPLRSYVLQQSLREANSLFPLPYAESLPEPDTYRQEAKVQAILRQLCPTSTIEGLCERHNLPHLIRGAASLTSLEGELDIESAPNYMRLKKFEFTGHADMPFASQYIIWYGSYNARMRLLTLWHGTLAFMDILIMPLLLPLMITYYRWPSIKAYIGKHPQIDLAILTRVGVSTACLALDFLFLWPVTLLLFVTQVRWVPLLDGFRSIDFTASGLDSFRLYARACKCVVFLVLDVLSFPGLVTTLLLGYRAGPTRYYFTHPYMFHTFFYFMAIARACFFMLLDSLVLLPLALCAVVLSCGLRWKSIVTMWVWEGTGEGPSNDNYAVASVMPWRWVGPENHQDIAPYHIEAGGEVEEEEEPAETNLLWATGCVKKHKSGAGLMNYGDFIALHKSDLPKPLLADSFGASIAARCNVFSQFLLSFIDALCIILGLIVMTTLWRASKITLVLGKVRPALRTWPHGSPDVDFGAYHGLIYHIWMCCIMQFALLIADILCLPLFAVVLVTLYRFPAFVAELLGEAASGGVLRGPALFHAAEDKFEFEFPFKGGPYVRAGLTVNYEALGSVGLDGTATSTTTGDAIPPSVCIKGPLKMHVLGKTFWDLIQDEFGYTVVGVGKSMLPLRFSNTACNLTEVSAMLEVLQSGLLNTTADMESAGEKIADFWAKVDAGSTKRSSVYKKLARGWVPNSSEGSSLVMQFEANLKVGDEAIKPVVLLRLFPSLRQMEEGLAFSSLNSGKFMVAWNSQRRTDLEGGIIVDTRRNESSGVDDVLRDLDGLQDTCYTKEDDMGLVDCFAPTAIFHFAKVLEDICHVLIFVFVFMLAPWRMMDLISSLCAPVHLAPHRVAQELDEHMRMAENHLYDYYHFFAERLNNTAKEPDRFSDYVWQWGTYRQGRSFRGDEGDKSEEWSLNVYRKRMDKVLKKAKNLDDTLPGVTELKALFEERKMLGQALLALPVLKAKCMRMTTSHYVERGGGEREKLPSVEEEPYMMTTMLLNVRTSQNRARLIDNKRLITDQLRVIEQSCVIEERRKVRAELIDKYREEQTLTGNTQLKGDHTESTEEYSAIASKGLSGVSAHIDESDEAHWVVNGKLSTIKERRALTSQKFAETKAMLRSTALLAAEDSFYVAGSIILFATFFKLVPFLSDLYYKAGSCNPSNHHVRYFVRKHVNQLIKDAGDAILFTILLTLVVASVFSIPRLITGLPGRMRSLRTANRFLIALLADLLWTIVSFIMRICSCYLPIIALYLGIFSVFTPATCVADSLLPMRSEEEEITVREMIAEEERMALDKQNRSHSTRRERSSPDGMCFLISFGFAVWGSLAVAAVVLTVQAAKAGESKPEDTGSVLQFAIYLLGGLAAYFIVIYLLALNRRIMQQPVGMEQARSNPYPTISTAHIYASLTGPFEAAQLCAVVCYFLWPTQSDASTATWAAQVLAWGDDSDHYIYHTSMNVAVTAALVWFVLVTLPSVIMTLNITEEMNQICCGCVDEDDVPTLTGNNGAHTIRRSQIYLLCELIITRLFNVWFMATLIRPLSCMEVSIPYADGSVPASVLTTTVRYANGGAQVDADLVEHSSDIMTCGGGGSWAALLSTVALVYYVVTVTSISADDGDQLSVSYLDINSQHFVKFAPSYALMMRAMQLSCLVTAMIGSPMYSSQEGSQDASLVILFFSLVMAIAPLFTYLRGFATCSFEPLTVIRSACSLCVAWTSFILFQRHSAPSSAMGGAKAEVYLFYGWAAISSAGLLGAVLLHHITVSRWMKNFKDSPLHVVVMDLFNTSLSESLTVAEVEEAVVDSRGTGERLAAGDDGHGKLYSSAAVEAGLTEERAKALMREAQNATSMSRLAVVVAKFEDSIIAERLHPDFIVKRPAWKHNLLNAQNLQSSNVQDMSGLERVLSEAGGGTEELQTSARAEVVMMCCKELQKALLPASHLHYADKYEMQQIFSVKRIPSDAVATILEYLVDIKSNSRGIMPVVDDYLEKTASYVFEHHNDRIIDRLLSHAEYPSHEILAKFKIGAGPDSFEEARRQLYNISRNPSFV